MDAENEKPKPISGFSKVKIELVTQYDIENEDAERAIWSYMDKERETISDSITTTDIEELAEMIYSNSKYWD